MLQEKINSTRGQAWKGRKLTRFRWSKVCFEQRGETLQPSQTSLSFRMERSQTDASPSSFSPGAEAPSPQLRAKTAQASPILLGHGEALPHLPGATKWSRDRWATFCSTNPGPSGSSVFGLLIKRIRTVRGVETNKTIMPKLPKPPPTSCPTSNPSSANTRTACKIRPLKTVRPSY